MRNLKKKIKYLVLGASFGILVAAIVVYSIRYTLWQHPVSSMSKTVAAHTIWFSGTLRGKNKDAVTATLGSPDHQSGRYALLLLRREPDSSEGMTADLLIKLDAGNRITEICYAWKDFVPPRTNHFDSAIWKHSDTDEKILMTADLIRQSKEGELREKFGSLGQVEDNLGKVFFVDEWRYRIADWKALVLDFERNGTVAHVSIRSD